MRGQRGWIAAKAISEKHIMMEKTKRYIIIFIGMMCLKTSTVFSQNDFKTIRTTVV